jgi:ferredoxin
MPKITVKDRGTFDIEEGKRLVLAIEDSGIDILHRCGGYAKCTTCRVQFFEGEPERMTVAELNRLSGHYELIGIVRLSCQIPCDHDMTVKPLMTLTSEVLDDPGQRPQDTITPDVVWTDAPKG